MYEQRFSHRMVIVTCLMAATSLCTPSPAAEFSNEATALPYPPDTQNLEFTAWAGDINLESQSPLNKLQSMVSSEDDPSFGQLYEFDFPSYFEIQLGEYFNFSLSVPGIGIGGKRIEQSKGEMKIEGGRVRGTIEMPAMKVLSRQLSFAATIDAELMTPSTRIRGPGDPATRSENPVLADSPVPMPEGAEDVSRSGSNLRQVYRAVVAKPMRMY